MLADSRSTTFSDDDTRFMYRPAIRLKADAGRQPACVDSKRSSANHIIQNERGCGTGRILGRLPGRSEWRLVRASRQRWLRRAMLDQVSSEYSVDASRVYAAGLSQGGMMSYILSVARPNIFAAIASVAGPRPFDFGRDTDILYPPNLAATPDRPFPLLHMHGTGERFFIPYEGGPSAFRPDHVFPPVEEMVGSYAANNGCDTTSSTNLPDVNQTVPLCN